MDSLAVDALWSAADELFHQGDHQRVILLHLTTIRLDPHFVEAYLDAAYLLWSAERHEEAVALYHRAAQANPTNAQIWAELGYYYMVNRRDYPKAVAAYSEAVKRPHDDYEIDKALAHAYEKAGHPETALAIWSDLHRRYPKDGTILHNLNRLRSTLGLPNV